MKKTLVTLVSLFTIAFSSLAQNVEIPDSTFKSYLLSNEIINYDENKTEISIEEAKTFSGEIYVAGLGFFNGKPIKSLSGIEAFINITSLNCNGNMLKVLDISKNIALTNLDCGFNELEVLDISKNTALTWVYCSGNNITNIDLTNNLALQFFSCKGTLLKDLDVSKNLLLESLICLYIPSLRCIKISSTQDRTNWGKDSTASYSENCNNQISDFAQYPQELSSTSIISSNVSDFARGRNSLSDCNTGLADTNVIDSYYSFITDADSVTFNLTLGDETWQTSMELVDTLNYSSIVNTCLFDIDNSKLQRKYTFKNLTIGQKYEMRLEIGSTSPIGHVRMNKLNNSFTIQMNSTINGIENIEQTHTKEIVTRYNLQGQVVTSSYNGLVIVRYKDGTIEKIVQ